jgi:hypothetical protein
MRSRPLAIGLCGVLLLALLSCGQEPREIVIWKVGSSNTAEKPAATVPPELRALAARSGLTLRIESFPMAGFAATFRAAVKRNSAPDLLAYYNYGVLSGITTPLPQFDSVKPVPVGAMDFIQIRETFDSLLAPTRGWVMAFKHSRNHSAVKALALSPPECAPGDSWQDTDKELASAVTDIVTAYLQWNKDRLRSVADTERLETEIPAYRRLSAVPWEPAAVHAVKLCGWRGNSRLAMAWTNVSAESQGEIGHTRIVVVLRKDPSGWKLLVASRDPVTNRDFVNDLRIRPRLLLSPSASLIAPAPVVLLSPAPMAYPMTADGKGFGTFSWKEIAERDVVAEIAEFAYDNDARMFLVDPMSSRSVQELSEAKLWHTNSIWQWRVWSLNAAGDIAFSESRPLPH